MEREPTTITLRKDIKKRARDALEAGKFVGPNDLGGLIDVALDNVLTSVGA